MPKINENSEMVKFQLLMLCLSALVACGQTVRQSDIKGLAIDPNIGEAAKRYMVKPPASVSLDDVMSVYANSIWAQYFENDTLSFADTSFSQKQLFKSFYLWKGDTLVVHGVFGLFGGFGFAMHLYKNEATLYHLVSADEFKTLAYQPNDSLTDILRVRCSDTQIILSELPSRTKKQEVYGYVAFESDVYYQANLAEGKEWRPRVKNRANMRIYFRSSFLKL
jgi:hypothetical protein